jgi:ATP-dependent Lhr-like helicase
VSDPLDPFRPAVREWFQTSFAAPTRAQALGWPAISRGESTLILAPTGSGKTLAAFLWCVDRVMFSPIPAASDRCRILYISPLKALAVDVERNLRAPIAGIANVAARRADEHHLPAVAIRTGDTPATERARFRREPADILITTPESLYLLLTSNAREVLRSIDTVIVDEIHALVPTKRGAHLALSLERLEHLITRPLQRIGLSATQRPLDEVARFLGGSDDVGRAQTGLRPRPERMSGPPRHDPDAPIDEIDHEFGGDERRVSYRPVTVVDASEPKTLELRIEVPVEDMPKPAAGADVVHLPASAEASARPRRSAPETRAREGGKADTPAIASGPASPVLAGTSIWSAIYPRLLELIQQHRSTLVFVNNRRTAERLAGALNDLAGEPLVRSHHGSLARPQRVEVEDLLKAGRIRGLVATSSLELGIDMGAIDLVVQIEAPPSVASGMQRIGRAGHQVGATSRGVIVPKYRGDLVACAAVAKAMHDGRVESTRYPRNPLDILAQQIVAMASMDDWRVADLFGAVRRAAPFASLGRGPFEGVLDMLAGRYPSDEFAELRPRVTWDRVTGTVTPRENAKRVAVINGGTIPDRGLYGVFLLGAEKGSARVGELDEEMVFESRTGETFVLGASTWRIEEITHDRMLVSPAPGEPGKMPFWKADAPGRPLELGREIGRLVRELRALSPPAALERLTRSHDLDRQAAENLLRYLRDEAAATGVVPDDRTIVIERCRDELGDWRICVLSPFGGRVHAPWAMAAAARIRDTTGIEVETMWTDDGFVARFPESDDPPDAMLMVPAAPEVEPLILRQLGATALFAAKFRENAARALLLPKRRPGGRTPLWQQRKRAADLLAVAARFGSFPMLLETYRECLRDVFDMPALVGLLTEISDRRVSVVTVDAEKPSPFASSLLFGYVANYIYEGDAPLAERRAQALTIDQTQLRELIGEAELRELLDEDALFEVERELQHLHEPGRVRTADALHDLLLRLGDLSHEEIAARTEIPALAATLETLIERRRIVLVSIAGTRRYIPAEYASRYRDAAGTPLPVGLPDSLLESTRDPHGDLILRYSRTHGPSTPGDVAQRYGLARGIVESTLRRLVAEGRLLEGEFRPGGSGREWVHPDVLRVVRRRSLAKLRQQAAPVEPPALARLVTTWQGVTRPRAGLDALLDTIEILQGAPLPASILEREILSARIAGYNPADLDALTAAGEIVWCGIEPLGERDGRIALYLTDQLRRLWPVGSSKGGVQAAASREPLIIEFLRAQGASFFGPIHTACGGGFPAETIDALWNLVWSGVVTNDGFHPLRAFTAPPRRRGGKRAARERSDLVFRSRRLVPPTAAGRWSLIEARLEPRPTPTEWSAAVAEQLLTRYGVVTREVAGAEGLPGRFSAVYDVLRAMEESGRIRRGYFVSGVGATQFARPAAVEMLRTFDAEPEDPEVLHLAATDPANPYGVLLPWPGNGKSSGSDTEYDSDQRSDTTDIRRLTPISPPIGRGPIRAVGASVILVNGTLAAYIGRGGRQLSVFLPEDEPPRSTTGRAVAERLATLAQQGEGREGGMLITEIDGVPAREHPLAPFLTDAGFSWSALGYQVLRRGAAARDAWGDTSPRDISLIGPPEGGR